MTRIRLVSLWMCLMVLSFSLSACSFASSPKEDTKRDDKDNSSTAPAKTRRIEVKSGFSPITGLAQKQPLETRPLCVMIDNVRAALPQRGLSSADILYEMVTESGITRIMAMFEDYSKLPPTGPVRSARDQHVSLMLPMGSLFLHVGSSTYAADMLDQFHYKNYSINGFYEDGALKLDTQRSKNTDIEHCWFTDAELFTSAAQKYSLNTQGSSECAAFDFAQEKRELSTGKAENVQIRFSGYVTSNLLYNAKTGLYEKYQFGEKQIDENTGEGLSFDNVLVLFTEINQYPDKVLAKVNYNFGGVGYYINGGKYEDIRWQKGDTVNPLLILSADGKETSVTINPGKTYVAVVALDKYKYFNLNAKEIENFGLKVPFVNSEDEIEAKDTK